MEQNYHSGNRLIVFSLKSTGNMDIADVTEAFYETACNSLRASDVVTTSSKSRVMVLLLESNQMYAEMVIDRVLGNWSNQDASKESEISFEMDVIK